jgi:hypothetical protein
MTILLHSKLGPAEVSALISICANACQPCAALITVINLDCRVGQSVRILSSFHAYPISTSRSHNMSPVDPLEEL